MKYVTQFFTNYMLMSAVFSWLTAQIIKVMTGYFNNKHISVIELLFGSGGMPSSHTAAVMALFVASFVSYGPASPYVAITGVLLIIVIRDATGVRREMGEQAKIINKMVSYEQEKNPQWKELKERVGHTPKQAFFGGLVGLIVPLILIFIPVFTPEIGWL